MGGMSKLKHTSALATSAAMGFLGLAPNAQGADSVPAVGNEGGDLPVDEVIVTARRRTERQQDVPIAISAFNDQMLERNNITDVQDLNDKVPGLQITPSTGGGENNLIFAIRGQSQAELSSVADPSVSLYINDIPAPRASGANVGFYDIAGVEVLKGPQGTLFGRNTTGGAILVRTNQPVHDFEASLAQTVGNYNARTTEGMINLPISDGVALRVAGSLVRRDGYITDVVTDRDVNFKRSESGRVSLLIEPSDAFRSVTAGSYSRIRSGSTGGFAAFSLRPDFQAGIAEQATRDIYHIASGVMGHADIDLWTADNNTSYDISDHFTIKNIAGYRQFDYNAIEDLDGTRALLFNAQKTIDHDQYSDELQLLGEWDRFNFILGGFYFREHSNDQSPSTGPVVGVAANGDPVIEPGDIRTLFPFYSNTWSIDTNTSAAAFFQGTFKVTSLLSLTAGIRYTSDKREMTVLNRTYTPTLSTTDQSCRFTLDQDDNPATPETRPAIGDCRFTVSKTFREPTYNLSADYKLSSDALVYVAHRHGYRSGGFGPRGANQVEIEKNFLPEIVNDYEIGLKADWYIGGAFLRTNLAGYLSKYEDMQRYVIITTVPAPVSSTNNAAKAEIRGVELDVLFRPFDALEFDGFYSYADAKFKGYLDDLTPQHDLSAQVFPRAPENQWGLNARFTLPLDSAIGELSLGVGVRHQDGYDASDNYSYEGDGGSTAVTAPIFNAWELIPGYTLWNARVEWNGVLGSKVDLAAFVDNLTDKEWVRPYQALVRQFASQVAGEPRMVGVSAKISF